MILDKIKNTIGRYNLINRNDKIVLGVSGGPDSVALTLLLNSFKKELNLDLHIAHLDHMLRKDSSGDREFVEGLAHKLKLPVSSAQINVGQLARRGSLEEIARNARLEFLFKVAKDKKINKIALGHNLDDQAETVLMRILRGTGLQGLYGILPKIEIGGFQIIRPLIEVRRKDIEKFLKKRKAKARIDTTNFKDIYFRNKIRNRLIPLLEREYNKNIKGVLSNMAENIGYDYDYLTKAASRAKIGVNTKINLDKFLKLHTSIRRLRLRMAIAKLKGNTRRITFQHIKELEDLSANRPLGSIVDLPKGISVIKMKKYLSFYRR